MPASMVNAPESPEEFVYHYTSLDKALRFILHDGTIRFNPLSEVNDPRESKRWKLNVSVDPGLGWISPKEWDELQYGAGDVFRRGAKLCCFTLDHSDCMDMWNFSARSKRGYASAPMWHHYGDKHGGLCLMFDRSRLNAAFEAALPARRLKSRSVEYTDEGWVPSFNGRDPFAISSVGVKSGAEWLERLGEHFEDFWPQLYFRKLTDWANEREYRWLFLSDDDGPVDISFQDALVGIFTSGEPSQELRDTLYRHCITHKAGYANVNWTHGQPSPSGLAEPFLTHKHLMDSTQVVPNQ